ncbi:MAG TPA: glycosyltransferase family 39 protein [Terriglobia bacterium]|nr:glycosyltransferase family 39 protein [Terriglobia bacterium]
MRFSSRTLLHVCLLVFVVYVQFFFRLGAIGLVGPDEPRYAQVAREMAVTGDYVTPHLGGEPWFEKPVLYYWLTALAYKLHGVDESAARFASVVSAALGVGLAYWLGRAWLGPRGGVLTGLILATSVLYFSLARAASMDMLLAASLTGAWTSLYFILFPSNETGLSSDLKVGRHPCLWHYLFYGFLAIAVLAKGPVGLILVGGSLLAFLILTRRPGVLRKLISVPGLFIFLAISLPWYWLCYRANGAAFIQEFIVQHNLERFATDRYRHSQPAWFYLGVLFAGFFPWVFQLVPAAVRLARERVVEYTRDRCRQIYFGSWVAVPLIFFTFSRAKLPGYILPIAPAVALLIAREFELCLSGDPRHKQNRWVYGLLWAQAVSVLLLGVLLPYFAPRLHFDVRHLVTQLSILPIGVGVLAIISLSWKKIRFLFGIYVAGIVIGVVLIVTQLLPLLDRTESCRQLGTIMNQEGYTGRPVFILGLSREVEYGLLFYLNSPTHLVYSSEDLKTIPYKEIVLVARKEMDAQRLLNGWNLVRESSFDEKRITCLRHEGKE